MKRFVSLCALAGALSLGAPSADATPLLRAADNTAGAMAQLAPAAQRTLAAQVREARARVPAAFASMEHLSGLQPRVYLRARLRQPTVVRELQALGPDGLLPMLSVLAVDGYPQALAPAEREALEVGLLQAVGTLRDARAEPVLRAAFLGLARPESVRAAAEGLGALCGDAQVSFLAAQSRERAVQGSAALDGLGFCRRAEALRPLVEGLTAALTPEHVRAAARGLGRLGSTWAVQSEARSGRAVDPALGAEAARALVSAYARALAQGAPEEVRSELTFGVLAVGHADSPRLLREAAQSATPEARAALEALAHAAERALARGR